MVDMIDFIWGNATPTFDFIRNNVGFISLVLLLYSAWQLRKIARRVETTQYLLFRDYQEQVLPK
jgi:hypothetical protein